MPQSRFSFPIAAIIAQRLYYSPVRRAFRALVRRVVNRQTERRILFGPLRGARWFADELRCALGVYEMDVQEQILLHLKEGGVFYDIGANRGFFSLLAARVVGTRGHVYAFEPFPGNHAYLEKLFALNQLTNVTIVPKAVSDHAGRAEIFAQETGTMSDGVTATLLPRPGDKALQIETLALDDFLRESPAPNFIKMDIEGAEVLALKGAQILLSQKSHLVWLIECHSSQLEREVAEILNAHGYATRIIEPQFTSQRAVDRHLLAWKN